MSLEALRRLASKSQLEDYTGAPWFGKTTRQNAIDILKSHDAPVGSFVIIQEPTDALIALYVFRTDTGSRSIRTMHIAHTDEGYRLESSPVYYDKLSSIIMTRREVLQKYFDIRSILSPPSVLLRDSSGARARSSTVLSRQTQELWVWGTGATLGDGRAGLHAASVPRRVQLGSVSSVSFGSRVAAAVLRKDRKVLVWGSAMFCKPLPALVGGLPAARMVACGDGHVVALSDTGDVYCWLEGCDTIGYAVGVMLFCSGSGQIGSGHISGEASPYHIRTLKSASKVAAGGNASAALVNGSLYYWGSIGGSLPVMKPVKLEGVDEPITDVCLGTFHCLFLTESGKVYAFGANDSGQLGSLDLVTSMSPIAVPIEEPVREIVCGGRFSVAISTQGEVFTWGANDRGQLGRGEVGAADHRPQLLGGVQASAVSCGSAHLLILLAEGRIISFGDDTFPSTQHETPPSPRGVLSRSPSILIPRDSPFPGAYQTIAAPKSPRTPSLVHDQTFVGGLMSKELQRTTSMSPRSGTHIPRGLSASLTKLQLSESARGREVRPKSALTKPGARSMRSQSMLSTRFSSTLLEGLTAPTTINVRSSMDGIPSFDSFFRTNSSRDVMNGSPTAKYVASAAETSRSSFVSFRASTDLQSLRATVQPRSVPLPSHLEPFAMSCGGLVSGVLCYATGEVWDC